MLIISDTESLIEQAKRGNLANLTGKDKIYCFNERGTLIDISFINIVSQIKGNLIIIPGEIDPISVAYIIGVERTEEVKLITNRETNNLVNQVTLVTAATGASISFSNKIKLVTKEKEKRPREKKSVDVQYDNQKIVESDNSPISEKQDEAAIIEKMCVESSNSELNKMARNRDFIFKLRKAIMESSDWKIGFPLMLGLVMGKEQTNLILQDCEPIYRRLRPNSK